jgi:hypothetical protein
MRALDDGSPGSGRGLRGRSRPAAALLAPIGSFRAALGLSIVVALLLRVPFFTMALGVDEGGVAFVAKQWTRHGTSLYGDQWLDRPPLLVLLVRVAVSGGAGDAGVRVLGAIAAVGLVVVAAGLAREIGGNRAGLSAAPLAAVLGSSIALRAVFTPAELLAAVPSAASVLCLVTALRTGRLGRIVAAGALATCAVLVKQSFLDAGLAGVVFLVACALCRPARFRWIWPAAWIAGAALPLLAVGMAAASGYLDVDKLPYALLGFRIDVLHTLAGSSRGLPARFGQLLVPAVGSGLALAMVTVVAALPRLPRDGVIASTLGAWLVGGMAGVMGGGAYWPHYLIEIVPVTAVLFGLAVAEISAPARIAAIGAAVMLACTVTAGATAYVLERHPDRAERDVGGYIAAHAKPGDTQYVLYARANVLYYAGLPSPFPYSWSLMMRARPGAPTALYRLLGSARRPTWLVAWQDDDSWRLDRGGIIDVLVRRLYRPAGTIDGHVILRRREATAAEVRAASASWPGVLTGGFGTGASRRAHRGQPRPRARTAPRGSRR